MNSAQTFPQEDLEVEMIRYQEASPQYLKLLDEITDDELASLECPTYDEQEAAWTSILSQLTRPKIERLLDTVGFELIDYRLFDKSAGVINKIFFVTVFPRGLEHDRRELVLRICNPHKFWENGRNENEIAILKYIKQHTSIPVPKIFSYSIDKRISLIGCQYILMEKLAGITLSEFISQLDNPNQLPQKIIDQMVGYYRDIQLISPPNLDRGRMGFFNLDFETVKILQDGAPVDPCEHFVEFIDQQLKWCVKEMIKMKRYVDLAYELDIMRREMLRTVEENPDLDNLNFGDRMTISHGDLNSTNILVDPISHDITGIIDWDFCSHKFDCFELGFFQQWFDKSADNEAIKKRIESIKPGLSWYTPQKGLKFRKYFFNLVGDANQLGFYCSTWFFRWTNFRLAVRVHLDTYADLVREGLKRWPEIMKQLKEYKNS